MTAELKILLTLKYLAGLFLAVIGIVSSIIAVRYISLPIIKYSATFVGIIASLIGFMVMIDTGTNYILKKWGIEL